MYFEDFTVGQRLETGSRTVTDEDVDRFVELVQLDNEIFLSDEGARAAGHPARLVPGPFQLAIGMGLCQQAGIFDHVVAVAQFDQLRFRRPVHPGDSLKMVALVKETRPTSNPGRGLVVLDYQLLKGSGEVALTSTATYLMRTRS